METDLSLIEIGGADDSLLLEDFINEDPNNNINTRLDLDLDTAAIGFACSPLVRSKPATKPPRIPQIEALNDKDERAKPCGSSVIQTNNKENVNEDKLNVPNVNEEQSNVAIVSEDKLSTSNSTKEPNQVKRRKIGGFNLRKSLAWNKAFFTEEGVLDPVELSRLTGSVSKFKEELLSSVSEEGTTSLLKDCEASGDESNLQEPENKLFDELPVRSSKEDPKSGGCSLPKTDSSARVPKGARRVQLVKGVSRIALEVGGSQRPSSSSSHKSLTNRIVRNASTKDSKLPKVPASKAESSSVAATSKIAVGAKRLYSNQNTPTVNLAKNVGTKGSSSNSKFAPGCISSTAKSSVLCSGKIMQNSSSVRRLLSSSQLPQPSRATSGLKVTPDPPVLANKHAPTGEAGSSRPAVSLPQNGHAIGGNPHAQSRLAKPSGLRMPSPSIGFFAQPKVLASASIQSPRNTQSSNLHESNVPNVRKFNDNKRINEAKPSNAPGAVLRVPKEGIDPMKCSTPSSAITTSHPTSKSSLEVVNVQVEFKGLSDPSSDDHTVSCKQSHFVHENVDDQCGKQALMRNPVHDEVKYVSHINNQRLHPNGNKPILQSGSSEQSKKDNHLGNVTNVKEEFNRSRVEVSQGPSFLNSEALRYGRADYLTKSQHGEGVLESLTGNWPVNNQGLNASGVEISQALPSMNSKTQVCGDSGASNFIEHQHKEEVHESPKRNMSADNEESDESEVEISQAPSFPNSKSRVYGVSGTDNSIKQDGDEVENFVKRSMSADNQELGESGVEISLAPPSDAQVNRGADGLIGQQQGEEVHESSKRSTSVDNQELVETVEVSEASLLLNSETQFCGGTVTSIESQHGGVQEFLNGNKPVDYHGLNESEVAVSQALPSTSSEMQDYCVSGASNFIDHQHKEEVKASPKRNTSADQEFNKSEVEISKTQPSLNSELQVYGVSEANNLIEFELQQGEEVQESFQRNMSADNKEFSESEVKISQAAPSEVQVNGGADDSTEQQREGVQESSERNMPVDSQEVIEIVEVSEASPSLNSETLVYGGVDNLIAHQHEEGVQKSLKVNTPGADDWVEHQHGEALVSGGGDNLIENKHGEGVQESLKANALADDQEVNEIEVEISQALPLPNSDLHICSVSKADNSIEHQHGEEMYEISGRDTSVDHQELDESGKETSDASPFLNSEPQVQGAESNLIRCPSEEGVQEPNIPGVDNLIENPHEERDRESLKRTMSHGQELNESRLEISDASNFLNSEAQVQGGAGNLIQHQNKQGVQEPNMPGVDNLIEQQHEKEVHESSKRTMSDDHQKLNAREVEISDASPFMNSEAQVHGGADNFIQHPNEEGVQEPNVSGVDSLIEHQHEKEVHESSKGTTSDDHPELNESGLKVSDTSPFMISEAQVHGGADNLTEFQHAEVVQESLKANTPGVNEDLNEIEVETSQASSLLSSVMRVYGVSGVDDLIEHAHEEVPDSSQALPLMDSNMQVYAVSGAADLIEHESEEVPESLNTSMPLDNQQLNGSEVEISQASLLVNSETQAYGVPGAVTFIVHQQGEADDWIEHQHGEALVSGGGDNLIENKHGEGVQKSLKANALADDQEVNEIEVEISQASPLPNSDLHIYSVSKADNSIEHQHGEEMYEISGRDTSVDHHELNEGGKKTSDASPFLNSEPQVKRAGSNLIRCPNEEAVQEPNIPGVDNLIKHPHEEGACESLKRTMSHGQELNESRLEISDASNFLNSEAQVQEGVGNLIQHQNKQGVQEPNMPGVDNLIEQQHEKEVHESSKRTMSDDHQKLNEREVEISDASPFMNSEAQVHGGADNFIQHPNEGVQEPNVSGVDSLIEHQHEKEVHESSKGTTSDDHQELNESGLKVSDTSPFIISEAQVHGGADNLTEFQHAEVVQESLKANTPGVNEDLNEIEVETSQASSLLSSVMRVYGVSGVDDLIEHAHEEVPDSSQALPLMDSNTQVYAVSGAADLIEHESEEVPESLNTSMPLDNQQLNGSEVEISQASLLVNSETQAYGVPGADTFIVPQQGEADDWIEHQHGEALVSGGGDNLIENKHGLGVQEPLKANALADDQEVNEIEVEISQASPLPNSDLHIYSVSKADNPIEHQHGEEMYEISGRDTSVDHHELNEGGKKTSGASPFLNSEPQVKGAGRNLIRCPNEEAVQEPNIPGVDNLIKHPHEEGACESLKGTMSHGQELNESRLEISDASNFLNSEAQVQGGVGNLIRHQNKQGVQEPNMPGVDNLIEQQHEKEVHESSKRTMSDDHQKLSGSKVEISDASPFMNSEAQVHGGADNFIHHPNEEGVQEPNVSGVDSLIEHQHEKELHESSKGTMSDAHQELNENGLEISDTSHFTNSEAQVHGGANNLTEFQHAEVVQESLKANTPGVNQDLNETEVETSEASSLLSSVMQVYGVSGVDDLIEHAHEEVPDSSQALPLMDSNTQVYAVSGAADLIERESEEVPEPLITSMQLDNQQLNGSEVEISQAPLLVNSETQAYGVPGADNFIAQQHGEEVQESSVDDQEPNESEAKFPHAPPIQNSDLGVCGTSAADDLVEHQDGGEPQEYSKGAILIDNQDLIDSELEISQAPPLLDAEMPVYDVHGGDNLIEQVNTVEYQRLNESEVDISQAALLNSGTQVDGVSGGDDMIDQKNEKEVQQSYKRNTSIDNQELLVSEVEIPESLSFLNSENQMSGVAESDNLIGHQCGQVVHESFERNTLADDHDTAFVQFEDAVDNCSAATSVVNDYILISHDVNRQSGEQAELIMASLDKGKTVQHMENNLAQKNDNIMIEQSRISEGSLKDSDVASLTVSSESWDSRGIKEQAEFVMLSDLEEVQYKENCVPQKIGIEGGASEGSLENDCTEFSFSLENIYASGTKKETLAVSSQVSSMMQEICVSTDDDTIKNPQAEGSEVRCLDDKSSVENLDFIFTTQFGDTINSSDPNGCPTVGDNPDEQLRGQAEPNNYFPDEVAEFLHKNEHEVQMTDNTLLKKGRSSEEFLHDSCHENVIGMTPECRNSSASESRGFEVSQGPAVQRIGGGAGTVNTIEHLHVEEMTTESLGIKPSVENHKFICDSVSGNEIDQRNQDSILESRTSMTLNTDQTPGALITCSLEVVGSSTENPDLSVQTISDGSIPLSTRGNKSLDNISSKETESTDFSHCKISDGELMYENVPSPMEDKTATILDKRKSLDGAKLDALSIKHKLTAVPFSDEWLAALEAAGEDILTLKTGPVQNSPPDKSLPEPSPWSPVKRKNNHEIGPFDCTKCTSLPPAHHD